VEAKKPSTEQAHITALKDAVDSLTREMKAMRAELASR
jgi:hypothetical protein